jgi:predicted transcriptional regulator
VDQLLLSLTAEVVAGYISNNRTQAEQLPTLIQTVYQTFATAGPAAEAAAAKKQEAAINVQKSISPDHLVCLVCGKQFRTLKRHLGTEHGLTPAAYRERYGLPASYPIVAPDYAKVRSSLAKKIGLGHGSPGRPPSRKAGRKQRR